MKDLVGRCFNLADGRYRIVDIRQLGGDAMVYAELLGPENPIEERVGDAVAAGLGRTAFHYADIAAMLRMSRPA